MRLSSLIDALPVPLRRIGVGGDPIVQGVCDDSRGVTAGQLFLSRAESPSEAAAHLLEAFSRGASAALAAVDTPQIRAAAASRLLLFAPPGETRRVVAMIAERFHGMPSRSLDLVGVTGTNGKTTVCFLLQQLLHGAGRRCGLLGTVHLDDGRSIEPASLTTPGAIALSGLLARMLRHGCNAAAMEVSSHGLDQERVAGLRFRAGVFTNLSGDHLDYHGSMEAYAAAKRRLFESLDRSAVAIVNADDPASAAMAAAAACEVLTTSLGGLAEIAARVLRRSATGSECRIESPWGAFECRIPLAGDHNIRNFLAAAAAAGALGVGVEAIAASAPRLAAPPGRLEPVPDPAGRVVFVDYAHTDDALRRVLESLRSLCPRGARLRVVFGCGGDRDRTKRPRMGGVAAELADEVIVTSDNPRSEDPSAILAEIVAGIPEAARSRVTADPDRARAIEEGVARSAPGDLLLIAGKGHEDHQIVGGVRRSFDDRKVAAAALARSGAVAMAGG
jgi:UDP-N-acetylmuramoyl-L-alanyl-D-glutamate--2,6-diaminopimelate ligase